MRIKYAFKLAAIIFTFTAIYISSARAEERTVNNEADLIYWIANANPGDVLLFSPPSDLDFVEFTASDTISGSDNGLTIDGNSINNYIGQIVGDNLFPILDFTGFTVNELRNIEINDGNGSGQGIGGALSVFELGGLTNVAFRRNEGTHVADGAGAVFVFSDFTGSINENVHFDSNISQSSGGGMRVVGDFLGNINGTNGDVHFDRNHAENDGGGLFVNNDFGSAGNRSFITSTYFAYNTTNWGSGGGMYVGSDFYGDILQYTFFENNVAGGGHGGGLFVQEGFMGDITGARFTDNEAGRSGGGFWADRFIGTMDNVHFENNTAGEHGGAFFMAGLSLGTGNALVGDVVNSTFLNNSAGETGGAIRIGAGSQADMLGSITGSTFTGNTAGNDGGALYFYGDLTGNILNSSFTSNTATTGNGGAILFDLTMTGSLNNVLFDRNTAGNSGGALYFTETHTSDMDTVTFTGNTATAGDGGAIYFNDDFTGVFRNVSFNNNTAGNDGGAVYFTTSYDNDITSIAFTGNTATSGNGGAIFFNDDFTGVFQNISFSGNTAGNDGGAVYFTAAYDGDLTNVDFINNSTTLGNGGAIFFNDDYTGVFSKVSFDGNAAGNDGGAVYFTTAYDGNITDIAFTNNSAGGNGGALFFNSDYTGTLVSTAAGRTRFSGNDADGDGGAIYLSNDYSSGITGIAFTSNTAGDNGGALFFNAAHTGAISGSLFDNNQTTTGDGGAIYFTDARAADFIDTSFSNNSAGARGGALYFNDDFTGKLTGTNFMDNSSGTDGGAIYLTGSYANDLSAIAFTGNSAGGSGGALYTGGNLTGDVTGSQYTSNSADGNGGAIFSSGDFTGTINNNTISSNSAGMDGGFLYAGGIFSGSIANQNFNGNSAGGNGGAVYAGEFAGSVLNSVFDGNTAGSDGGAVYFGGGGTGRIENVSFTNNSAGGNGGGIYFDTSAGSDYILTFSAGSGSTIFDNNASATGTNSFYIGGSSAVDFSMTIDGRGLVAFYDPFEVAMDNNHNFSMTLATSTATLAMSGISRVMTDGGTAAINLLSGTTQIYSRSDITDDFTMVFSGNSTAEVMFGSNHTLAIMNMPNRDTQTPLFDFTAISGGNTFIVENGSTLDITRLLKPLENNKYLLVSGLDPNTDTIDVGEFYYLHPDGYTKYPVFENNGTEIWLDEIDVSDAFDPAIVPPNVVYGEACLTTWLNGTPIGLSLTPDQVIAVRNDFKSAIPEAAASLSVVGFDVHEMAAASANRQAFTVAGGGWGGFDTAGAGASNPIAESGSIIAGYRPVASDEAYANVNPNFAKPGFRMWSGYMGGFDRTRTHGGYSGYNVDTHGFLTGLAYDLSDCVAIGAYGGYSRSDIDFRDINADAKTDAGHFGLHTGIRTVNGFRAVADLSYSHANHTLKRRPAGFGTTSGSVRQNLYSAGVNLAYDAYLTPVTRLTPLAAFNATWLRQNSFTESGTYLASHVRKLSDRSMYSLLGLAFAHDFTLSDRAVLTPTLSAGWKHIYGGNSFSATYYFLDNAAVSGTVPSGCKVQSRERSRDAALIGAALESLYTTNGGTQWGVKLAYNLEAGRRRTAHSVFAGAELRF